MLFNLGPQVPGQTDPEDEKKKQQVPEFPEFLSKFPTTPEAPEMGGLAGTVHGTASSLAGALLGQERAQRAAGYIPEQPETPPTSERDQALSRWENIKLSMREGFHMLAVGAGSAMEGIAKHASPEEAMAQEILSPKQTGNLQATLSQYGAEVRRNHGEALTQLAQQKPQDFVDWALRETGRMLPLVTLSIGAGAATGGTAPVLTAFATAFGTSYPVNKGMIQNELEKQGLNKQAADTWSTAAAVPMALADAAYPSLAARNIAKAMGESVVGEGVAKTLAQRVASVAKHTGEGMVVNGVTMAVKEGIGIYADAAATNQPLPPADQVIKALAASTLQGAGASIPLSLGFGFIGESYGAHLQKINAAEQLKAEAAVANFDPDVAPDGTVAAGKRLKIAANGRRLWFTEDNKLTSKPTVEEYRAHVNKQVTNATTASQVDPALKPTEPVGVPLGDVTSALSEASQGSLSPQVVELNIRRMATDFIPSTKKALAKMTEDEATTLKADLESIAMDESVPHAERATAAARMRAIEYAQRTSTKEAVANLDVTIGAKALASRDDGVFETIATAMEAGDSELDRRIATEARALRAAGTVESQAKQVRERIRLARAQRTRGLAPGTQVSTLDGSPGKVLAVHPSGKIEVQFEGSTKPTELSASQVHILPQPGQKVKLIDGNVVDVLQVGDKGARVRLPNGEEAVVVNLGEIEAVSSNKQTGQRLAKEQQTQAAAATTEPMQVLPSPLQAVDKRTGQRVEITSIGQSRAQLSDDSHVELANLDFGIDSTPTFEAGTQPSEAKRHINFLMLPEGPVATAFEAAAAAGKDVSDYVNAAGSGEGLYLFPQPHKPGTKLYAVELPADARALTDQAKKALGVLSGKNENVGANTFKARVGLARPLTGAELKVSVVPDALRSAASDLHMIGGKNQITRRDYLKRLTDLNFKLDAETGAAIKAAGEAAHTAAQLRIDGRPGEAEVAEINAVTARATIAQTAVEREVADRQAAWERIRPVLSEAMTPAQRSLIEALNASAIDDLQELPGIGKALATKIIEARDKQGGKFETIEDLFKFKGLGLKRVQALQDAMAKGQIRASDVIGKKHEEALKAMLTSMPGRKSGSVAGDWLPTFEHPTIPGMHLVVDKETVQTAERDLSGKLGSGTRDVYHIRYITPEGQEVRARTIGAGTEYIRVPAHLAESRGGRGTPPAIELINKYTKEGRSISEALDEIMSKRRDLSRVALTGREKAYAQTETGDLVPLEKLSKEEIDKAEAIVNEDPEFLQIGEGEDDDGQATLIVEGPDGEKLQVPASQVKADLGRVQEPLRELPLPFKMSDEDVLNEVMREIRGFDKKAKFLSVGEWRSQVPGVYADVRQGGDGYHVALWKEPVERTYARPRAYEMSMLKTFESEKDAHKWLADRGFSQLEPSANARELFTKLPSVESLDQATMPGVEEKLISILDHYHKSGFLPQPVRDYATAFALRWNNLKMEAGPGGLFSSRTLRRFLGVYEVPDARWEAGRRAMDVEGAVEGPAYGIALKPAPDVTFEDGRIMVERPTAAEEANDIRVLDGFLLSPAVEEAHPAKIEQAMQIYKSGAHRERFLDMIEHDGEGALHAIGDRLVEVGKERRLGVVLDSKPGADHLTVQTFVDGKPTISQVAKSDVIRVRNRNKMMDYYRAAKDGLMELTNVPRTPDMGASPYDSKLGLDLIQDRPAYIDGLRKRVAQIYKKLAIGPDGNATGDLSQFENLRNAYIRMKELGIENAVVPAELKGHKSNSYFKQKYGGLIASAMNKAAVEDHDPLIPPVLEPLIRQEAYQELANTLSTVSPYGDVLARAKLGMLTERVRRQIDEQARAFGISQQREVRTPLTEHVVAEETPGTITYVQEETGKYKVSYIDTMPTYRKVEELMQNVWNPQTAHMLYQLRRDLGVLRLSDDIELPDHGFELRTPAMGSSIHTSILGSYFTFPREMAARHPTINAFYQLTEKARAAYGDAVKAGADVVYGLTGFRSGMNAERKQVIWDLLGNEKLGKAQERPSDILSRDQVIDILGEKGVPKGWDWYHQYNTLRNLLVHNLREIKRNELVRGFGLEEIKYDPKMSPEDHMRFIEEVKMEHNPSADEMEALREGLTRGEKIYLMKRTSNAKNAKPRSEVDAFLKLQDVYKSLADVPQEIKDNMKPWMREEFDFWSRYGIDNYVPTILQGSHRIYMSDEEGNAKLVAFAPSGSEALKFMHRVRLGDVDGVPFNAPLHVEFGKATPDYDTDLMYLGGKQYSRLYARAAHILGGKEGLYKKLGDMFAQELRVGGEPALPLDPHTKARMAELVNVVEDPYKRILLYHGRNARANYLLDIQDAYQNAREMDWSMSKAHGLDPVWSDFDKRQGGTPAAAGYIEDLKRSYTGEPTNAEKMVNRALALATTFTLKPKYSLEAFAKKANDPNYNIFEDPIFVDAVNNADFASRRWAQNIIRIQSLWRIGSNLMSAVINGTQHMMYTPARLIQKGVTVTDAEKFAVQGYQDMINYVRGKRGNEKYADLVDFAEKAGVGTAAARGTQGPGLGLPGGKPIFFSDENFLQKGGRLAEYIAMAPFTGAERSNRLASAFAARRAALQRGLDEAGQVQFARDIVNTTQFSYHDQALPPVMRGPTMRVWLQFQQYAANALKFEKDLLRGMAGTKVPVARAGTLDNQTRIVMPKTGREVSAQEQAWKSWLVYNATGLVLGGAMWEAQRPMWSLPAMAFKAATGQAPGDWLANKYGSAERRAREAWGTYVGDPEFMKARNMMIYGLPGLAGLNLSARLGVGGLDLDPSRASDLAMGPTGGVARDFTKAVFGEGGYAQNNKTATFIGLGAGELSQILGARFPMGSILAPIAAMEATSLVRGKPFHAFLTDNEVGREYLRTIEPTIVRGLVHTVDVFGWPGHFDETPGITYDPNFQQHQYAGGLNRAFEAAAAVVGAQTIRTSEERTLLQYKLYKQTERMNRRKSLISQAATYADAGSGLNDERVLEIIKHSVEEDALIWPDEIQAERDARRESALARTDSKDSFLRGMGRSNPSREP